MFVLPLEKERRREREEKERETMTAWYTYLTISSLNREKPWFVAFADFGVVLICVCGGEGYYSHNGQVQASNMTSLNKLKAGKS